MDDLMLCVITKLNLLFIFHSFSCPWGIGSYVRAIEIQGMV